MWISHDNASVHLDGKQVKTSWRLNPLGQFEEIPYRTKFIFLQIAKCLIKRVLIQRFCKTTMSIFQKLKQPNGDKKSLNSTSRRSLFLLFVLYGTWKSEQKNTTWYSILFKACVWRIM